MQVLPQRAGQIRREPFAHHHPQHRDVLGALGHGVRRHLPAVDAQCRGDVVFVVAEVAGQLERHHRDLRAIRDDVEMFGLSQLFGEPQRGRRQRLHHVRVAGTAQSQEVVVLADDLVTTLGEVQREGRHIAAEIVDPEDQILGKCVGVTPHHEPDTGIGQPVLMTADVDRRHPRQLKVPHDLRMQERDDETTTGGVDVHRDIQSGVALQRVQCRADLGDRLEFAGVGGAQDPDHPDGVFVNGVDHLFRGDHVTVLGHRQVTGFDFEVATELLPHHLNVGTHHQVGRAGLPGILVLG